MAKRQRNTSQGRLLVSSLEQEQEMGGAAMPQPPQNWPRKEKQATQSGDLSRNDLHDLENSSDSSATEEKSKRPRGPTLMHSGWGKDGGILHIEVNDIGQTIGPEKAKLSSNLGVLARNGILAPLNYKDWRLVPDLYKDRIWAHIKENTDATDGMRRIIMMSVGSKWKEWKHEAKSRGYDPYNNDIERLAHRPNRVEEDQWRSLVHYWSSEDAKEKSERNKESRKKLTMPHISGRQSFSQIIDKLTKQKGVKPTRVEVFKETHMRKKEPANAIAGEVKEPVNTIAGEVMKDMDDIAEIYPELNVPGGAPNDVYAKVMGPDTHGTVRTLGKGAAPSYVYGPVYKRSQVEQRDFDAKVEIEVQKAASAMRVEMEKEMSEAKQEMEIMKKKMSEAKEEMEAMEKRMLEAKAEMETKLADKVNAGIQAGIHAYLESLANKEVTNHSNEDCQQWLSSISIARTNKVNINKNNLDSGDVAKKKKWHF